MASQSIHPSSCPPSVIEHVRAIYARGQALGRYPYAFDKISDSMIEYSYFLIDFDRQRYTLGVYDHLQVTLDQFRGYFARRSAAMKVGQHSWTVMNPGWVNSTQCQRGETPVAAVALDVTDAIVRPLDQLRRD